MHEHALCPSEHFMPTLSLMPKFAISLQTTWLVANYLIPHFFCPWLSPKSRRGNNSVNLSWWKSLHIHQLERVLWCVVFVKLSSNPTPTFLSTSIRFVSFHIALEIVILEVEGIGSLLWEDHRRMVRKKANHVREKEMQVPSNNKMCQPLISDYSYAIIHI